MAEYRKAKRKVELSQNELAEMTGIPQSTISAIENDRVKLGVDVESAVEVG